jgi:hypothetical protein
MSDRKNLLKFIAGSAWTISLALVAADWAWWHGFNDGADTSLCAMAVFADGNASAMKRQWCRNIQNRKPPIDLFRLKRP